MQGGLVCSKRLARDRSMVETCVCKILRVDSPLNGSMAPVAINASLMPLICREPGGRAVGDAQRTITDTARRGTTEDAGVCSAL